jgi:hypothetical protein
MKKYYLLLLVTLPIVLLGKSQVGQSEMKFVKLNSVPKPNGPAKLVISDIYFIDAVGSENKSLDANETALLNFNIENKGIGDAFSVKVLIQDSSKLKGISYGNVINIGTLLAGKKTNIVIPVMGSSELVSANANFLINVVEGNGFNADPFSVTFNTNELKRSVLSIDDTYFVNKDNEDTVLNKDKLMQLKLLMHNKGQGDAKNISVEFYTPPNIFNFSSDKIQINELKSDQTTEIKFEFYANNKFEGNQIPIKVKFFENFNKLVLEELKVANISNDKSSITKLNIQTVNDQTASNFTNFSLLPDVDKDIPQSNTNFPNRFALIIGNEDYSSFQTSVSKEVNVDFAKNDAKIFKVYCEKTLGIPTDNITLLYNATYGNMMQSIDKMKKLLKVSEGKMELFFFYAGHGLPDEASKEAYLIPVDISGSNIKNGIKLQDIYNSFSENESAGITMFIDACFSGGARNKEYVANRGVKVVPRSDFLNGNIVSFTASSGNQTSSSYSDKKHGLFTYFLLKAIQETKGDLTYKKLWDYLKSKVPFESLKVNNKEQEPQINIGDKAKLNWENRKFIN